MDREKFISRLYSIHPLTREQIDRIINDSIQKVGGDIKRVIAIEEMSEFTKEISKEIRGEGTEIGLLEEMADVLLSVYQLQKVLNISDDTLHRAVSVKAEGVQEK